VTEEEDRLRRQLRALAAVNRQLQAQLEASGIRAVASPPGARSAGPDLLTGPAATGGGVSVRRGSVGAGWLEQLAASATEGKPFLARRPDGATFAIDGSYRRRLKAGLLTAALEERLGPRREVTDDEIDQWAEGPPVEVMEAPSGPPFIVLAGERIPLRGLPLTHPVSAHDAAPFPPGRELSLSPGGLARARLRSSVSARRLAQRTQRATARHGGIVPAASSFGRRQLRRVRRRLS
jgi:hypothetical protein